MKFNVSLSLTMKSTLSPYARRGSSSCILPMEIIPHIPANTPVDNVLYYNEVYEELSRR